MICPYCNSTIPDKSVECFVCGEDLLPKRTSGYYTDMDAIKEEDEKLYNDISKDMGIAEKKLTDGQIIAMIITVGIAIFLMFYCLDTFKLIKYKSSSLYVERDALIVGLHYISRGADDSYLTTDCIVAYEYNGEIREDNVKAGFHYNFDDIIPIYLDPDGNPYHFVFSIGDMLQAIIILSLTALSLIVIARWHVMPNADGHLDKASPGLERMRERQTMRRMSRDRKWWRYF